MAWNRTKIVWLAIPILLLLSCGTDPRDYNNDSDYRWLRITGIKNSGDSNFFAFPATDDSGCDGVPDTNDAGEGDHWPDLFCDPGESIIGGAVPEQVDLTLQNFARVTEEVPDPNDPSYNIYPEEIIIEAFDDNWQQHDFAPPLRLSWSGSAVIGLGGTAEMLAFPLTRDSFKNLELLKAMNAAGAAQGPLWTWHYVLTVVARDNYGHRYYDTGYFPGVLFNPMWQM